MPQINPRKVHDNNTKAFRTAGDIMAGAMAISNKQRAASDEKGAEQQLEIGRQEEEKGPEV